MSSVKFVSCEKMVLFVVCTSVVTGLQRWRAHPGLGMSVTGVLTLNLGPVWMSPVFGVQSSCYKTGKLKCDTLGPLFDRDDNIPGRLDRSGSGVIIRDCTQLYTLCRAQCGPATSKVWEQAPSSSHNCKLNRTENSRDQTCIAQISSWVQCCRFCPPTICPSTFHCTERLKQHQNICRILGRCLEYKFNSFQDWYLAEGAHWDCV